MSAPPPSPTLPLSLSLSHTHTHTPARAATHTDRRARNTCWKGSPLAVVRDRAGRAAPFQLDCANSSLGLKPPKDAVKYGGSPPTESS